MSKSSTSWKSGWWNYQWSLPLSGSLLPQPHIGRWNHHDLSDEVQLHVILCSMTGGSLLPLCLLYVFGFHVCTALLTLHPVKGWSVPHNHSMSLTHLPFCFRLITWSSTCGSSSHSLQRCSTQYPPGKHTWSGFLPVFLT